MYKEYEGTSGEPVRIHLNNPSTGEWRQVEHYLQRASTTYLNNICLKILNVDCNFSNHSVF